MRRVGARVGGVSSISGAIESRRAFSVGAGVGPGYLSGGGRRRRRRTSPQSGHSARTRRFSVSHQHRILGPYL